jgi:hypothetical protein
MMQELAVAVIVLAAVAFLARKFFGGQRQPKQATTFVPLSQLKKKPPDDHCH